MNRLTLAAGTMCTLIGPPGCGKSTFAAQWPDTWRVSPDFYRKLATDTFSVKFSVLSSGDVRPLAERSGGPSTGENE
ncbi:hypothetical protein ABT001_35395 [Streptomyces sp. NPDC002793]|uniref:hypothetical protein n=1 Tax=Streptomyces sp. NPDC002793 TaxID=3154432 RepID=UPI003326B1DF